MTTTALSRTELVVYSLPIILLKNSAKRRYCLIGNGYTMVAFVPVCCREEKPEGEGNRGDKNVPIRL